MLNAHHIYQGELILICGQCHEEKYMTNIIQRVKQLGWAISANFKKCNEQRIKEELTMEEQKLFFAMSKVDQYHSYRVYEAVNQIWEQEHLQGCKKSKAKADQYEYRILKKTALLHDTGRIKGQFSIIHKVMAVVFDAVLDKKPKQEKKRILERIIENRKPRFLYVYYQHPILSKNKLEQIGSDPLLLELTEYHHSNRSYKLLDILKRADSQN